MAGGMKSVSRAVLGKEAALELPFQLVKGLVDMHTPGFHAYNDTRH